MGIGAFVCLALPFLGSASAIASIAGRLVHHDMLPAIPSFQVGAFNPAKPIPESLLKDCVIRTKRRVSLSLVTKAMIIEAVRGHVKKVWVQAERIMKPIGTQTHTHTDEREDTWTV